MSVTSGTKIKMVNVVTHFSLLILMRKTIQNSDFVTNLYFQWLDCFQPDVNDIRLKMD